MSRFLIATACLVLALAYLSISLVTWAQDRTQQQQPPGVAGQQAQADPAAQTLSDSLQGLVTSFSLHRAAILGYDQKVSQTFADQRAKIMWWEACGADTACWEWIHHAQLTGGAPRPTQKD